MAQILLSRTGYLPGDGREESIVTEYYWDTSSRSVITSEYTAITYVSFSRPLDQAVDTYPFGSVTRYVYHDGLGGVSFQDVAPPPPPNPDPLVMTGQVKNVSTYGQADGSITVFVSGGTSPYTYQWADGHVTKDRSGLVASTYQVRATDAAGRFVEQSFQVLEGSQITDKPDLVATLPANGAFSHSPIVLVVESEQIGAAGVAIAYMPMNVIVAAGQWISVEGIVFTAGDELSDQVFDRLNAPFSLVSLLNNTPALSYKYEAYVQPEAQPYGYNVWIKARKPGSRYTPAITHSGTWMDVSVQAGTDATRGDSLKHYGVLVEVLAGFTGNFNVPTADNKSELRAVATLQRNYQPSNRYEFDLSGVLGRLLPVWRPDLNSRQLQSNPQSNCTFYCRLYEMFSTGASNYRQQVLKYETPLQKVLLGVLPQGVPNSSKPWTYFADGPCLPLTRPLEKPVPLGGVEFFSFVLDYANQAMNIGQFQYLPLQLRVTIFYRDGTEAVTYTGPITTPVGGVFTQRIDQGAFQLGGIEHIAYYQVQAIISTTLITVPHTVVPFEPEYTQTTLMFLSTLGVFETFAFAGQAATKVERQATTYTRTLPLQPSVSDAYENTREVAVRKLPTFHSHPLSREVFDWLIELLKSPQVYQVDEQLRPVPVLITDYTYEADSLTNMYSVAVTLKPHRTEAALSL